MFFFAISVNAVSHDMQLPSWKTLEKDTFCNTSFVIPRDGTSFSRGLSKMAKDSNLEETATRVSCNGFLCDISCGEKTEIEYSSSAYHLNNQKGLVYVLPKITLKPKSESDLKQIINTYGNFFKSSERRVDSTCVLTCNVEKSETLLELANRISETGLVIWCEPDILAEICFYNTFFNDQYYLHNTGQTGGTTGIDISAPRAWSMAKGNPNIKVAVIDQGVDPDHEDLYGAVLSGYTAGFNNEIGAPLNANSFDAKAHGVCCAGIIGALDNEIGIKGVASGVKILPINIMPYTVSTYNSGWASTNDVSSAILWAAEHADVISCSWGYMSNNYFNNDIANSISYARNSGRNGKGCPVVFASGNQYALGTTDVSFPANLTGVITVGAIDKNGDIWNYSQRGASMDLVAPSGNTNLTGDVVTTDRMAALGYDASNYTSHFGGTSASCPQVAGVAALMLSIRPDLTEEQVRNALQTTAKDLGDAGFDTTYGYGLVDAGQAVYSIKPEINGTDLITGSSAAYFVSPLDSTMTVNWSVSNLYGGLMLSQDTHNPNSCTITRVNGVPGVGTLYADIYVDGVHVGHLSKFIMVKQNYIGSYKQDACNYYGVTHPSITSKTLNCGDVNFIHQGCMVTLNSQYIRNGINITHSGVAPDLWYVDYTNHKILFSLPLYSAGTPFNINFGSQAYYVIFFSATGNGNVVYLNISNNGTVYTLSIIRNDKTKLNNNAEDSLGKNDCISIYNAITGENVLEDRMENETYTLDTSKWKNGISIVRAVTGEEIVDGKMVINR